MEELEKNHREKMIMDNMKSKADKKRIELLKKEKEMREKIEEDRKKNYLTMLKEAETTYNQRIIEVNIFYIASQEKKRRKQERSIKRENEKFVFNIHKQQQERKQKIQLQQIEIQKQKELKVIIIDHREMNQMM